MWLKLDFWQFRLLSNAGTRVHCYWPDSSPPWERKYLSLGYSFK